MDLLGVASSAEEGTAVLIVTFQCSFLLIYKEVMLASRLCL